MRKSIKRMIAGVLSAVLSLSLVNFSALSMSLASELSGYGITVEYSEDNTSAALMGDTSGLKENVQLDKLVDSQGQEMDPTTFSQTVEENGTYHFTLYYQETVDSQDGDQPTTEEKTQELEVVVNNIGKPQADQPEPTATPEVLEGVDMGTEDEKDGPPPFVQKEESMTAAPKTVPLDVLMRAAAESRATKTVHIYADEAEFKLSEATFNGGPLVPGAAGLPTVNNRTFARADYIINGTSITRTINGLYSYNDKWYYTVDGNTVSGGDAGNLYVGFELPDNATVRLHYKVTNTQQYTLNFSGVNGDLADDFKLTLNGKQEYKNLQYAEGTKVVLEFSWPVTLSGFTVNIPGVGNYNITSAQKLGNNALTEKQIWETSDQKYTLVFSMPPRNIADAQFNGVNWTDADTRNFAIGSDFMPGDNETFGDTGYQDYFGDYSGSFFKSMPKDPYNSPGMVTNATVSHKVGGMDYTWPSTFQVYEQGGSSTKPMQFAQGTFKSNQLIGFTLRMDRRTADYAWKANSLVMNVYIGQPYTSSNTAFRQYTIQLAYTKEMGSDSTRETYLDCGAMVKTQCWQWTEEAYFYRIYIYNMTHNFTLYDRPAKSNQESFVIATKDKDSQGKVLPGLEGIKLSSFEDPRDGSYASNQNSPWTGAPILPNTDFQASWLQGAGVNGIYQKYFYIRSKYGYTAPVHWIDTNKLSQTVLSPIGQIPGVPGLYQFTMQVDTRQKGWATKTPTLLNFTAKPLKWNVGYYPNGNVGSQPYHSVFQMTADQNATYAIEQKLDPSAGNQKLKGYQVRIQTTYYVNRQQKTQDVLIPPPSDPTNDQAYWYPNRDVLTFSWVYDYLQKKGMATINETTNLRIIPNYLSSSETSVQARWEMKVQNKFAALDNDNAGNRNLTADNATVTKQNINAYLGSTVSLYGNKDRYEKDGKKYQYNEAASRPTGKVTADNPIAVSLEYLLATTVQVDIDTLGTGNNGETWNHSQQNNWYTSVNNFNHQFDLNDLQAGTKKGEVFISWGIRKSNKEVVAVTDDMKLNSNLDFYKLGKANGDLWSDIFNKGTCTLVAMWKSDIPVVTSADNSITNKNGNDIVIKHNSNEDYQVVGTFKYGDGSATEQDIKDAFNSGKLKITLLFKDPEINGDKTTWLVRYVKGSSSNFFGEPTFRKVSDTFTVTFESNQGTGQKWMDGANFRIFAWTESNQDGGSLTPAKIAEQLNGANGANPFETKVPSVNVLTKKIYAVDPKTGNETVTAKVTDSGVQLTTEFHYGYDTNRYPGTSFTEQMLSGLIGDGTIKAKLERKTLATGDWSVVSEKNSLITAGNNGTITFNYTLAGENLLDFDKNQYRITVWTEANGTDANTHPSYIFNVQINVERVTLGNDSLTNEDARNITILHNVTPQTYQVVGTFKYGDGSITQEQLDKLFANGTLKIGLLFKDPQIQDQTAPTWQVRYQNGDENPFFGKPSIQKVDTTFTVTFTSSRGISEKWMDGGNFRIFAWTISNPEAGSLTVENIKDQLNSAGDTNPYEGKVPSVNVLTEKVYQISTEGETEKTVTAKATEDNVVLSTTFHYDFDTTRYPNTSFTQTMLENLIADDTIQVKLEKKGSTGDWSSVDGAKAFLTAGGDGTGTISFSYTLSGENLFDYDNNQFRITVWTAANGATQPSCTFTVKVNGEKVTLADDSVTNQNADDFTILDGVTTEFSIVGTFKYGEGTATEQDIINAFNSDKLKIALMIKDPQIPGGSPKNWEIRYKKNGVATFGDPIIEKADSSDTFTVTFKVNADHNISGAWSDGANFRVFAWTEENQDGAAITPEYIAEQLNGAVGEANPLENKVPSMNLLTKKVYQISTEGEEQETVNAKATDDSVQLKATFRYAYAADRYPNNSFTQQMLNELITNGTILIKLEQKTTATGEWTAVADQTNLVTAGDNGMISFSYMLDGNLYSYNNNQFRITVWTAANGDTHPSHTFTVNVTVKQIKNEGGVTGPVAEKAVEVNDGASLTVESKFRYGDGTEANLQKLQELIDTNVIHIVLLKMDPPALWGEKWAVHYAYGADGNKVSKPTITMGDGESDFKVSFKASEGVSGPWDDGSKFRILVWTDANGLKDDNTSITATDIANTLNNTPNTDHPNITNIPWEHFNVTLLYKVVNQGETISEMTVLSTDNKISLAATFKYNYDQYIYPGSNFTAEMLKKLIDEGKIHVKLEKKMKDGQWGDVASVDKSTLTAGNNGIISFAYDFTDTDLSAYDGAQFRVTVWSNANISASYPTHTITVTYISDPTAYVDIPKYIILDDNSSNVVENGNKQDGYAGKKVDVKYNENTMAGAFKPSIEVKVQDGVKLKEGNINGVEMADMPIGIYGTDGAKMAQDQTNTGYCSVGTLTSNTPNGTLSFWMNTKRGTVKNQQYYATVMFMLELAGTAT